MGRSRPITRSGRLILSGCVLLVAIVLGLSGSVALYQVNRDAARSSALLGALFCGPSQRIDDVPARRRARRMICRDAQGIEIGARDNPVVIYMGLPLILLLAAPALWFVARADIRERRG